MKETILVADDEDIVRESLEYALTEKGYGVMTANGALEALRLYDDDGCELVIADLKMPGMDGIDLIRALKDREAAAPIIIITAFGAIETAVEAIKLGAYDYITKPFDTEYLLLVIERCLEKRRMMREIDQLREEVKGKRKLGEIVGSSDKIKKALDAVERVAQSMATVLIEGKSGTGKELFARAIHENSRRSKGPFVAVNCGGLPETLLESELFGHVKGAFTGAAEEKEGLFEAANGGTIFLDEVASMSPSLQVALLRVLQEREIRKVGSNAKTPIDVRVVAASSPNLGELAKTGAFREDLLYRLNVVTIPLPELWERKSDIPQLVRHFIKKHAAKNEKDVRDISRQAMEKMLRYDWPGNVRELENKIEQAVVMCQGESIESDDFVMQVGNCGEEFYDFKKCKQKVVDAFEKDFLRQTLRLCEGNVTRAAELAGLDRTGFQKIMKKHDLHSEDFRSKQREKNAL